MDFPTAFSLLLPLLLLSSSLTLSTQVSHDGRALLINGERRIIISGSIHYPRSTTDMWPDLIQKGKEGGLNTIETYVFWNIHEPRRREYNFEGNYDLIRFLKTVQEAGLYAILRIGPYACAEWNYGGFPMWLQQLPGVQLRNDNKIFKNEMRNFTALIVDMIKQEKLLAPQGGPIILTQIENEYGNIMGPYGEAGKRYVQWCAKTAESFKIGIPWIMCQQEDAPQPIINTCNGFYCDAFTPNNANSPKMWTENWTGWFKKWGEKTPHRPAEDIAYAVALFFQTGGTLVNYYMYHGGTNFGRTAGGPFIVTSYDYDAPIDEYGHLRQPKWGHLKQLHALLISMEKVLTHGDVTTTQLESGTSATMYTLNGTSACFLSNNNSNSDASVTFQGKKYSVPAWSVSILPDCKNVAYNTAIVSTQTSITAYKQSKTENEPEKLNWVWRPEIVRGILRGKSKGKKVSTATELLDQKYVTGDVSDYLWYTTSVKIRKKDPLYSKKMILSVNTAGHILYAFFNGKLVGSGKYDFVLEVPVNVKSRENVISLLSVTVGLQNYGSYFELAPAGIVGGPVKLIGNGNLTKDLSNNTWTYKVGLNGEDKQIWASDDRSKWISDSLLVNRGLTWYKTTFKAPLGKDSVVVDLEGLGKGQAWVNGHSLGRYWPAFLPDDDHCGGVCDYRGKFDPDKCRDGCGQPTQRWYHVPRQFLKDGEDNTLVLFEELGGNPLQVNFQTVTVGTVCSMVNEGNTVELACQGDHAISQIQFASYGDPEGSCGSFKKGACEADNAFTSVQKACVGKTSCSITVWDRALGASKCGIGVSKRLAVQAVC